MGGSVGSRAESKLSYKYGTKSISYPRPRYENSCATSMSRRGFLLSRNVAPLYLLQNREKDNAMDIRELACFQTTRITQIKDESLGKSHIRDSRHFVESCKSLRQISRKISWPR